MALSIEYFEASGNAVGDGVFIPISDLPGIQAAELAAGEAAGTKESKSVLAMLNAIFGSIPNTVLGMSMSKGVPAGGGAEDLVNQSFTYTWQKVVNLDSDSVAVIPAPVAGANFNVGNFFIPTAFPNAVKVNAAGAVSGAGIVVNTSGLNSYSSVSHSGLTVDEEGDNRAWFSALFDAIATDSVLRNATDASAIVARVRGAISALAIPASFTAATDPTSGLSSADLPKLGLISRTSSITIQLRLNQETQAFEVNSVTT